MRVAQVMFSAARRAGAALGAVALVGCAGAAASQPGPSGLDALNARCLKLGKVAESEFLERDSEEADWATVAPFHELDRLTLCFDDLRDSRFSTESWRYYSGTADFVEMTNATGRIEVPFVATFDPHGPALRLALCHGSNCTTRVFLRHQEDRGFEFRAEFSSAYRSGTYRGSLELVEE
jgi:hypothetical protein